MWVTAWILWIKLMVPRGYTLCTYIAVSQMILGIRFLLIVVYVWKGPSGTKYNQIFVLRYFCRLLYSNCYTSYYYYSRSTGNFLKCSTAGQMMVRWSDGQSMCVLIYLRAVWGIFSILYFKVMVRRDFDGALCLIIIATNLLRFVQCFFIRKRPWMRAFTDKIFV